MLLSELIKKNILLLTDDVYKLKESSIIDENEAEIETEVLYSLESENEVPTIPDTQATMTPQLLDSPQTNQSSNNYKQLLYRIPKLNETVVIFGNNLHKVSLTIKIR